MIRNLLTIAGLDIVYLVVLGRATLADAAAGALWAGLFLWWFHAQVFSQPQPGRAAFRRALGTLPLTAVILGRGLKGSFEVAAAALRRRPGRNAGFVELPLGERTPAGVAASALFESMTPGSVAVAIDEARHVIVLHVLDAADKDAIRTDRERLYRRHQRRSIA